MFSIDVEEWGRRDVMEEYRSKADLIQRPAKEAA
jgi:hypothetical protein